MRQPGWGRIHDADSSDLSWGWVNGVGADKHTDWISPQEECVTGPLTLSQKYLDLYEVLNLKGQKSISCKKVQTREHPY